MNPTAPAPSHAIYAWVLGGIVLSLLTVSLSRLAKTKTRADYLVAGRSLPVFVLVFTLLSSWIGSGSLLGGAENAYNHGFAALWQAAGGWAGLLLIYFIAPRARKFAQFTIPDLLEARYNQTARVLGVIAILFAYTAITSYQLIGGGDILHLIFPAVISADMGKYVHRGLRDLFYRDRRHVFGRLYGRGHRPARDHHAHPGASSSYCMTPGAGAASLMPCPLRTSRYWEISL